MVPRQLQVSLGRSRKLSCSSQLVGYNNQPTKKAPRTATTNPGKDVHASPVKAKTQITAAAEDRSTAATPAEDEALCKCHGRLALVSIR